MQISSQNNALHVYQQRSDATAQSQTDLANSGAQNKPQVAPVPAQKDSVTLSNDAKLLAEANRAASTDDGSRTEKIARLRQQVQNGTYVPNERGIAEGILREDSALFAM